MPLGAPPDYPEEAEGELRAYAIDKTLAIAQVFVEVNAGRAKFLDRAQVRQLRRKLGRGDTLILPAFEEVFWTDSDLDRGLAWAGEWNLILHVVRFGDHTLDGSTPAGKVALATLADHRAVRCGMANARGREARAQREILKP